CSRALPADVRILSGNNVGDGDNLLFTVRGSPRPVSWLGSRTESVIAAMAGDWYRYQIRKPGPIVTVMAMIYCPFVSTINDDDHNFMFTSVPPLTVSLALASTPSNYKFYVCGMQKGAQKAARTGLGDAIVCLSKLLDQLQAASVNLVAREKFSDVYLEIAARIQTDEPDTGGGGHGRHQLLLFTGDIISFPRVGSVRIRGKPRTLKLKLKVAEDIDFKREGSSLM
ncbi:hypothetical protein Tco_0817167, partial [Tanacetum coccineum]